MTKHRGGRGRRAKNKHETVTISLLPELKAALDAAVTDETSRSEVVAQLISTYLVTPQQRQKAPPAKEKTLSAPRNRTPKATTTNLPHAVTVIQPRCPRGESMRWNRERYEATDALLAEGYTITRNTENADYHTEKGNVMSWRTVKALLKLGVLVPVVV